MTVEYARSRQQFGNAIGSYQAVQYLCTDIGIASHLTDLLARRAAWLMDTGRSHQRAVAASKFYASRAAAHMTQRAHEVFAGLGFMMEHDLHLFTRHAKHWEHDFGDVRHHGEELVEALRREFLDRQP
jgi:alkylation response protein AidB-like acyl-CoA dehydrogenase